MSVPIIRNEQKETPSLTVVGSTLSIEGGNTVTLPTGGTINSVTGTAVDNTDPSNPIIDIHHLLDYTIVNLLVDRDLNIGDIETLDKKSLLTVPYNSNLDITNIIPLGLGNLGDTITIDNDGLGLYSLTAAGGVTMFGYGLDNGGDTVEMDGSVPLCKYGRLVIVNKGLNLWRVDGGYKPSGIDLYGNFAGSFRFPSSTNVGWSATGTPTINANLTSIAGTPTELQYTSVNSSGGDSRSLDIELLPVVGDVYRCTGELFYQTGTFAHVQLRQNNSIPLNKLRYDGDILNTTTWQPFTFDLTMTTTDILQLDLASDGTLKVRNLKIVKL